jgi:hypothetical protein
MWSIGLESGAHNLDHSKVLQLINSPDTMQLRSYGDDSTYFLDAYCKLDPITSPEGELCFLQALKLCF